MVDLRVERETDQLWQRIAAYLEAEGLELDDLEIAGSGPGRVVRIVIDADAGVDVDRLAETSRALSRLFDAEDVFDGAYTLEVTSPGLERKLRRPRHWEKSVGRTVTVKTTEEVGGTRRHDGQLASVDERGVVLDVDGTERRLDFEQVASARTVFEWERKPKPGKKSG